MLKKLFTGKGRFFAALLALLVFLAFNVVVYLTQLAPAAKAKDFAVCSSDETVPSVLSAGQSRTVLYTMPNCYGSEMRLAVSGANTTLYVVFTESGQKTEWTVQTDSSGEVTLPFEKRKIFVSGTAAMLELTARDGELTLMIDQESGLPLLTVHRTDNPEVSRTERIFIVASAVVLAVALALCTVRKIRFDLLCLTLMVLLSGLSMFVYTPNSIPDEPVHYDSAYYYSNILTLNGDANLPDGRIAMRAEDIHFRDGVNNLVSPDNYTFVADNITLLCKDSTMTETEHDAITTKPLAYLAGGIGIAIGRILGLSGAVTYYLGRFCNMLLVVLLAWGAIRLIPFGKAALLCIMLLPITTQLSGSYSYDNYNIGTVLLLFSYILRLMYGEKKIGWKQLLLLLLLILIAVPYKIVYITVAALVLLLPKKKFVHEKLHFLFKVLLGVAAVAAIVVTQFAYAGKVSDTSMTYTGAEGYTLVEILSAPARTLGIFARTVYASGDSYLLGLLGGYGGWFQSKLPWITVLPFLILLFVSFCRGEDEPHALKPVARWYSLLMFLCCIGATMLVLMLDWTPKTASAILGVQGRYFLPALPALFLAVRGEKLVRQKQNDRLFSAVAVWCNLFAVSVHVLLFLTEGNYL